MPRCARRFYPTKYATDLTDAQWAAIAPLVFTPSPNGGRPTDSDRRVIVHALRDLHRTGGQWRMRPKDEGYTPGFNEGMRRTTTIRLHVIEKPPGQKGCAVIPKRWVRERSMA